MAAPVDAGRAVTNITTAADPWASINLPASIAAGDLLIAYFRIGSATALTDWTGWTQAVVGGSDAADDFSWIYYKVAAGTEGTTAAGPNFASSVKGGMIVWRITGAQLPSERMFDISTVATGTGANPDPGSVTPGGGTDDYLFIEIAGLDGETQTFTASTNYSNIQNANSGTGGAAASNVRIGGATRGITATSAAENPGTMTAAAPSTGWEAWTLCIKQPNTQKAGTDSATGTEGTSTLAVAHSRTDTGGVPVPTGATGSLSPSDTGNRTDGDFAWTSPGEIAVDDGFSASVNLTALTDSHSLYGITLGANIPAGASILGIEVVINDASLTSGISGQVTLTKDGTNGVGTSRTFVNQSGNQTLGSSSDLWGTTWTESEIESINFGFLAKVFNDLETSQTGAIDKIHAVVYYATSSTAEFAVTASDSSAKSGTDSSTGTDASAEAAALPGTESSTGTDTSALATQIAVTDSGAGTEASAVAQSKEGTDTGSGAEVSVLEASFLLTDTGVGTEASVVDQTKDAVDSGAGSDASTLAAAYVLTDTGSGVEASSVEQREDKVGTDTGKGAEGNAPVFTDYDVPDLDSSTNATSYATPSWTPPTSGLALVFISARANTGSGAPPDSVTGNGVTWVNVASAPTGTRSFDLYAANLSGATAGAVTIDFGTDLQNYCTALFSVVSDADLSGGVAAAFAQAVTATGATGTPSFLMAPASSPVNRAVAGFIHGANEATTPKGTWTELDDSSGSADNRGTEVSYFPDWFDAEVSATWATTSVTWIAIAAEVKGLGSEYVDAAIPLTDSGSGADASTLAAVLSATEDTGSGTDTGAFDAAYAATDSSTDDEQVTSFVRDGITDSGTLSGEVGVTASADATPVTASDVGSGADSAAAPRVDFTSSVSGADYAGSPWDYGQPIQSFSSVTNSDWGAYAEWTNATTAALQSTDGNVVSVTAGPDTFSEDLRILNWGITAQGERVTHVYVEFSAEVPFPGANRPILYVQLTRDGGSTGFDTFSLQAPLSGPMTIRRDVTTDNLTRSQVESANFGVLFYLDTPVAEGGQASIEYVKLGLKYEQETASLVRDGISDSGAGSEVSNVSPTTTAETGSGTDVSALAVDLPLVDSAAGTDSSVLAVSLSATETGSGADSGALDAAYALTDTGSGTETGVVENKELFLTDSGTGVDAATAVDAGVTQIAGTDSGSGSEVISAFAFVTGDKGSSTDNWLTYDSGNEYTRKVRWIPGGNADWSNAEPWAVDGAFPYDTTYAEAVIPPYGVTDYIQFMDFPLFYDNIRSGFGDESNPAPNRVPYLTGAVLRVKAVEGSGITMEVRLKLPTGSTGNYLSRSISTTAEWFDLSSVLAFGPLRDGFTETWAANALTAVGGLWDHPDYGVEVSFYSNVNAERTVRIESVQGRMVVSPQTTLERGVLNFASSDSATGTDSSTLTVSWALTDDAVGTDASQPVEIGAHGYDNGTASEASSVVYSVTVVESTVGVDASILEAQIGRTDTGSATELITGMGRLASDSAVGVESLGSRVFGAVELISVLDVGDANWWLIGSPTYTNLALTGTSVYTESLTPSTTGTQTLTPASTYTEVLTTANTDTNLVLNPIDYEPQ